MHNVTEMGLTDRQKREREYYDQFAASYDVDTKSIDLSPVEGPLSGSEKRPWNSYWAVYQLAYDHFYPGAKLLDFGSGPGENALRLSKLGYDVAGFDISPTNVKLSRKLFEKRGESGNFKVAYAEELPYEDNSFDMIAGIDILHHVDIPKSLNECWRVLKPGGKAVFREPVEAPFLDWIRNTRPVLVFAPKEASLENHITEDERKLNRFDEKIIKEIFPKMRKRHYLLFSRFDKFYRKGADPRPSLAEKFDYFLIKRAPCLKKLCGAVVYELEK